jgi:hypothetical protein
VDDNKNRSRVAASDKPVDTDASIDMEYRTRQMKVIGLLGGMSWESSIEYERIINEEVRRRLDGVHSRGTSHSFL